jgi:hypothetical protein
MCPPRSENRSAFYPEWVWRSGVCDLLRTTSEKPQKFRSWPGPALPACPLLRRLQGQTAPSSERLRRRRATADLLCRYRKRRQNGMRSARIRFTREAVGALVEGTSCKRPVRRSRLRRRRAGYAPGLSTAVLAVTLPPPADAEVACHDGAHEQDVTHGVGPDELSERRLAHNALKLAGIGMQRPAG